MSPADLRTQLATLVEGTGATVVAPPLLLPANPFFDLAGEEFGRRLFLTTANDGSEFCLRPDFTLPIASAYLNEGLLGQPAAFGYLGPIFRQRDAGPAEIDQAGIELLGQPDPDAALDTVFGFAGAALRLYEVEDTTVLLGSVALFEAILAGAEMPEIWRGRIRHRFGHPEALARLLERLADPQTATGGALPWKRPELVGAIAEKLQMAGMSLQGSRTPVEIADRYLEKQALASARVPAETLQLLNEFLRIVGDLPSSMEAVAALGDRLGTDLWPHIERLARHAEALASATPPSAISFDASFAPRLDYYTGIVFQTTGRDGAVLASGGEYDRLLERLGAGTQVAASGCAVWVDRLLEAAS